MTTRTSKRGARQPGLFKVRGVMNLYRQISAGGGASYVYRFRLHGKRREMGLGSCNRIPFDSVKKMASKIAGDLLLGVDPIEKRDSERTTRRAAAGAPTFKDAVEEFLTWKAATWKHPRAAVIWLASVRTYAYPAFGDLPLNAIGEDQIVAAMNMARNAGHAKAPGLLRTRIAAVLDRALALKHRDRQLGNPARSKWIDKLHETKREAEHFRAVALESAPKVFQALQASQGPVADAWVFLIATAARCSEAINAQWSEIDFERRLWTLPAARMKSGREHIVPLSDVAIQALRRRETDKRSDAVFAGSSGRPISSTSVRKGVRGIDSATPHGWRSTFADWCNDKGGVPSELRERALAHALGKVIEAYNRSRNPEARREVMERYGAWLEGAAVASNVIVLAKKKA